jgi:UDP-N-acetylmuramoyl-L-alanyl-D-glutamate--2,6-diaminopimelate ligase
MSMPAEELRSHGTLRELLKGIGDAPDIGVTGISSDSKNLSPGDVFFALIGETGHGLDHVAAALAAGARAVVWDSSADVVAPDHADVPMIPVAGLTSHIGEIANRFFDSPSRSIKIVGVTGTNGKTTVSFLVAQCMQLLGKSCAYLGTLGFGIGDLDTDSEMTTPACIDLHKKLAAFRDAGAGHAAIEVSSHALQQDRINGVHFDSAIFTNLSRDHIDYHGSMRAYGETKARLFLDRDVEHRIISMDTDFGQELADRCGRNVVTVSTRFDRVANGRPFLFVRSVVAREGGSNVVVNSSWGDFDLFVPLPGNFNVANAIGVLGLLLRWDVPVTDACEVLGKVSAPPGRMQRVAGSSAPSVYVDYAHTPAGLEAALRSLRSHCRKSLWCVFGCGGDRDRGKRPLMGKTAVRLADRVVVTNDNPRSELPGNIIADILDGVGSNSGAIAIEDRATAIAYAIQAAADDDTVLIAGKGHENYQLIGNQRLSFSDYDAALANVLACRKQNARRR